MPKKMKKREPFPPTWKPIESEQIDAEVIQVGEGDYGNVYTVRLNEDSTLTVRPSDGVVAKREFAKGDKLTLPNHAMLMASLEPDDEPSVDVGWTVLIRCTGTRPSTKAGFSDTTLYSVLVGEPDTQSKL